MIGGERRQTLMPPRRRGAASALASTLAAALSLAAALTLAACSAAKPLAASVQDCGTTRTAANVPVEIEVDRGQVTCSAAMQVEASYAKAITQGEAPGNGGGGPVRVSGWTCQGLTTPELLKTGETSRCARDGREIVAILKAPS
jgi:hypothetical protein